MHAAPPTSVHTQETNRWTPARDTPGLSSVRSDDPPVTFRHSGWARHRKVIRKALEDAGTSARRLLDFDLCGSDPWVARSKTDPDKFTVLVHTCKSRWCIPCARSRGNTITRNLTKLLDEQPYLFVTFTLKHTYDPLAKQLDRLYESFRELRKHPFWKTQVAGGAAVCEVQYNTIERQWHPHLHVVIQARYLYWKTLRELWFKITGDSYIVDIQKGNNHKNAAYYLASYVAKPVPKELQQRPDLLSQLIVAFKGRRLVNTFGTWRGFRLAKPLEPNDWESLCPLDVMLARRAAGDREAAEQYHALFETHAELLLLLDRGPPKR